MSIDNMDDKAKAKMTKMKGAATGDKMTKMKGDMQDMKADAKGKMDDLTQRRS